MCKSPITLEDGTVTSCHNCPQCRDRAIDDWSGRCTAESKTASASFAVTLTYGRDKVGEKLHPRAVIHTYSDVQKFLKLLRRHGYDVRYFITGEFGERKGRVHWHCLLFFYGDVPPFAGIHQKGNWICGDAAISDRDSKVRFNWVRVDEHGEPVMVRGEDGKDEYAFWWRHGFVEVEPFHHGSARYACKYIAKGLKGDGEADPLRSVVTPKMSKLPPLGAHHFAGMAEQYVKQGLAPQDLFYRFDEVRKKTGKLREFMLADRSAELFLEHYCWAWEQAYPGVPCPPSELVANWQQYGVLRLPALDEFYMEHPGKALPARALVDGVRRLTPPLAAVKRRYDAMERAEARRDKSGPKNVNRKNYDPERRKRVLTEERRAYLVDMYRRRAEHEREIEDGEEFKQERQEQLGQRHEEFERERYDEYRQAAIRRGYGGIPPEYQAPLRGEASPGRRVDAYFDVEAYREARAEAVGGGPAAHEHRQFVEHGQEGEEEGGNADCAD